VNVDLDNFPFKTGKQEATYHPEFVQWIDHRKDFLRAAGNPTIPTMFGHANSFHRWGMLGNGPDDTVFPGFQGGGDCTIASGENETKESVTNSGRLSLAQAAALFNGKTAIGDYKANCPGYNEHTGENDNGCDMGAVMTYRQKVGLLDLLGTRHKIGPFVAAEPGNPQHIAEIAYLFESCNLGIMLYSSAQDQFSKAEQNGTTPIWSWVAGSESVGGHCVPVMGRPAAGYLAAVTWELRTVLTSKLLEKTCEEAYGYVTGESFNRVTGKTYEGFDHTQLEEYLHNVHVRRVK
jgi:hypothetical protein